MRKNAKIGWGLARASWWSRTVPLQAAYTEIHHPRSLDNYRSLLSGEGTVCLGIVSKLDSMSLRPAVFLDCLWYVSTPVLDHGISAPARAPRTDRISTTRRDEWSRMVSKSHEWAWIGDRLTPTQMCSPHPRFECGHHLAIIPSRPCATLGNESRSATSPVG